MNVRYARLLAPAVVLVAAACGTTNTAEHIPVIPQDGAITGASPDAPTLDPQAAPAPATTTPAAVPAAAITGGKGLPVSVDVGSIGVHAKNLVALGLNKDGSVSVPSVKTPQVVGFYAQGGRPCVSGPQKMAFTLISHIDGAGQRGGFADLKNLKPGDTVTVGLDNGKSCTYRIKSLDKYDKNNVPIDKVWGPTPDGEAKLISCGGAFVGGKLGYADNLVGTGVLVG